MILQPDKGKQQQQKEGEKKREKKKEADKKKKRKEREAEKRKKKERDKNQIAKTNHKTTTATTVLSDQHVLRAAHHVTSGQQPLHAGRSQPRTAVLPLPP